MYDPVTIPPVRDPGPSIVRVGADIGQKQDYTAIVVTEEERRAELPHYVVRSLERLPLGTSYPRVVDRVEEIMATLETRAKPRLGPRRFTVELIVDVTGIGLAIADMLRERDLTPKMATFTGSDKLTVHPQGAVSVGKGWMVGRLQVLLQGGRLHLPRTVEAGILARELMDYEISVSDTAHASFNAKSGSHDDLVIALGLTCGIDRTAAKVTSRSYVEPGGETLEDALRDRWRRGRDARRPRRNPPARSAPYIDPRRLLLLNRWEKPSARWSMLGTRMV